MRALCTLLAIFVLSGCATFMGPSKRELAVVSANAAMKALADMERQEQLQCIADAQTKVQARKCIAAVESRWSDVWKAWSQARVHKDPVAGYCGFRLTVHSFGITIPDPHSLCN